jgi:hypothetical protein
MTRPPPRPVPPAVVALVAALLAGAAAGGCAFDRNWKRLRAADRAAAAAASTGTTAPSPDRAAADRLAGRWEGTWKSERNNHSGKLRAIITPLDDTSYRAAYDATYLGLLRFGYSMKLTVQPNEAGSSDASAVRFQGSEDLGWLAGGVYRYDGAADGQSFESTYQSKYDHGRFRMTRPAP